MRTTDILSIEPSLLKTEEQIILAAMKVFADFPLDVASFRMIAKDAGVSISLIAYHFKSKENLYKEVLHRVVTHVTSRLQPYFEIVEKNQTMTPKEAAKRLSEVIEDYAKRFYGSPQVDIYAMIILREHFSPSAYYDILHENLFKKTFDLLSYLIILATGRANRRKASFHAISILGMLLGFRFERQIMKRDLGMTCYTEEEAVEIKELILRNTFLQLKIDDPRTEKFRNEQA